MQWIFFFLEERVGNAKTQKKETTLVGENSGIPTWRAEHYSPQLPFSHAIVAIPNGEINTLALLAGYSGKKEERFTQQAKGHCKT